MTPTVGMRVGRYELLQRIGAGGMGEVFRARDLDLNRDVALKFLPEKFASDPARLERFSREARAASSLNHPNIVTIHEIGTLDGAPFIVMECVEGRTLRDLITVKPLKAHRILDIGVQAAEGLAKAHDAGIVHRDLKPENLMVTADGLVKILDFGLAKLRAPMSGSHETASDPNAPTHVDPNVSTGTTEGLVIGTVGYMSPEQAAGRSVDFRSDQFSLGTILYEMVSGRRAFKRDTPVQTLSAIIEAEPESLSAINPSFSENGRVVIERCLAKEPSERYGSTADLARDLRAARDHLSDSKPVVPLKPRRAARRWGLIAAGALAALLVLIGTVPAVRGPLLGWLQLLPLPADKRIAVLPFRASHDDDRRLVDGLLDYVVASLGRLERFQRSAWVVPAVEVRHSGVRSANAALRALGATLVVEGSVQRDGDRFLVIASLIDATSLRQLRATTFEVVPGQQSLLDRTVDAVTRLLDLEMGPDARAILRAGGTGVAEASTLYAQALGYTPYSSARTALERADQERDLERAIELFNQALERDPQFALAHAGLGEAYWRLSRITRRREHVELAEARARRALEIDPLVSQAWITLGMIHTGTGRAEEAVQDLQKALDRDPRSGDAHRELANAYARLGKNDEAEATYRRAIELRPDHWMNHANLGAHFTRVGRHAEAAEAFTRALEVVPDNARMWSNLGAAYYLQSMWDKADAAFRRSMELYPTGRAASNLGTNEYAQGHYEAAARALEQAVAIEQRDYRLWRNLGAAYYWAPGERAKARDAYSRCVEVGEKERELDPQNPVLLADLGDCYALLGERQRALALAAEAAKTGGQQGGVARVLAGIHEHLGDRAAALEWAGKALRLGIPPAEIERSPSFEQLRADPRYPAIAREAMVGRGAAG
jgi:tetratricopeptide (TPR) repeat protein